MIGSEVSIGLRGIQGALLKEMFLIIFWETKIMVNNYLNIAIKYAQKYFPQKVCKIWFLTENFVNITNILNLNLIFLNVLAYFYPRISIYYLRSLNLTQLAKYENLSFNKSMGKVVKTHY